MAEEQKENQAQNGTQETRLPLSIDRSKEISKYMNVFNASFAYNEVFLEMGLGRVLDEAGKQVYSVRMNEVVSMTPQTLKALAMVLFASGEAVLPKLSARRSLSFLIVRGLPVRPPPGLRRALRTQGAPVRRRAVPPFHANGA